MTLPASKRQDDGWHITYDSYTHYIHWYKKHTEGRKEAGWDCRWYIYRNELYFSLLF